MDYTISKHALEETRGRLKLLMFSRVVFTSLLLGSTIIIQLGQAPSALAVPLLLIYALTAGIFGLSCIYLYFYNKIKDFQYFATFQVAIDTFIVTLILLVTGGFSSIFSFLYLVVLIYSSILLPRREVVWMATLCGIQYGVVVALEYAKLLHPFVMDGTVAASEHGWLQVFYRIVVTGLACFAVAILSGVLAEQAKQSQSELRALETHLKRVEKLASMGEIAAGMAHEIKNPLASLAGAIQLLQSDLPYNPQHHKLMQIVTRETARLSDLISNFLMFARPPTGSRRAVNLSETVMEIVTLFEKDASRTALISIETSLENNLWIEIDPVHFRQVFWNLLLNAAEAIEGTGRVVVKVAARRNSQVVLQVIDDGYGIAPEHAQHIFTPFFTTKPRGTGLGLSMVHSILESYDSRIDVDSEPGSGTVFTVIFQRAATPPFSPGDTGR
ncbi:MAG: ATP-binding protein [Pseudomonadota bacterium]